MKVVILQLSFEVVRNETLVLVANPHVDHERDEDDSSKKVRKPVDSLVVPQEGCLEHSVPSEPASIVAPVSVLNELVVAHVLRIVPPGADEPVLL